MSFDDARRAGLMHDLIRPLLRRPTELLPFQEVHERLHLAGVVDRGVLEVPLQAIVGTVGRRRDFTRAFLPRGEELRERWNDVKALAEGPRGFPAVELYQVGDVYFVLDGHHRVSVARSLGQPTIEAHVQEFLTPVQLAPDASLAEIVLKSALAEFLHATGLTQAAAGDFETTEPDGYERLLEHIAVHRYFRGLEARREIDWRQAVDSWFDTVYQPMVETIRASGILADFPGRTETDLYLFAMEHLYHLRRAYGDGLDLDEVVDDFAQTVREDQREDWRSRLRAWLARRREGRSDAAAPGEPAGDETPLLP